MKGLNYYMKSIISAAVTPYTIDGRLDLESARKLYEFNIKNGCDGFFILGSMGEWALLTREEKIELATCACEVIGKKAKVLLGVSDTGLSNIFKNMEMLQHLSHTYWTVILPGSWAGPACPVNYVHRIADAADRPIYLYYIPGFNGVTINIAQFKDILSHPNVAGLKNSSGEIRTRKELFFMKETLNFEHYEGEEWSIDEALAGGCDGAVAGFGSAGTKLIKHIANCVDSGDYSAARAAQHMLIDIFHKVYGDEARWWNIGQKYALKYMGIISTDVSRVEDQQILPEENKATIQSCIDVYRDWLV